MQGELVSAIQIAHDTGLLPIIHAFEFAQALPTKRQIRIADACLGVAYAGGRDHLYSSLHGLANELPHERRLSGPGLPCDEHDQSLATPRLFEECVIGEQAFQTVSKNLLRTQN